MSRTNDLVPFLAGQGGVPSGGKTVSFRQGVIVSWDQDTAENVVLVGTSLLTNLPILNTSEAAILAEGDVVGILVAGATWGIMGRFTIPGTPEAVTALSSLRTQSANVLALDTFSTSSSFAYATDNPGPTVEIAVGPSGRLLIFLSAEIGGQDSVDHPQTAGPGGMMGFELTGANVLASSTARAVRIGTDLFIDVAFTPDLTLGATLGATRAVLLTGLNRGLTQVTAMYRTAGDSDFATFANRNITALAL